MTSEQAKASLQPVFQAIKNMEVREAAFRNAGQYTKDRFLASTINALPGAHGRPQFREQFEKPLIALMSIVGLVLLIARANAANLLLAGATARRKEITIRLSLGASRSRIVGQLLSESVLLAVMGGLAGAALAFWLDRYLLNALPQGTSPLAIDASPDLRVFGFTFLISALTGVVFGLAPALQSSSAGLSGTLKDLAAGSVTSTGAIRFRKGLVIAQVSLSLLLLIGAGLFVRSLQKLRSLDPGFRTSRLLSFSVDPSLTGYSAQNTRSFYRNLQQKLANLPGVRSVALSRVRLLDGDWSRSTVTVAGYQSKEGEDMNPMRNEVSPAYFATMDIPLAAGREFSASDERQVAGPAKYAIVNERFAQYYFGGAAAAIGRRFGFGDDPGTKTDIEIIGVAKNTMYHNLRDRIPRQVFLPYLQRQSGPMIGYVRTELDPEQLAPAVRSVVKELDSGLPVFAKRSVEEQIGKALVTERMIAMLSAMFGGVATLLAIVSLYGVMAYTVARRTREIGIRIALGAFSKDVVGMVMREALALIAVRVAVGLPASFALSRYVRTQLYGLTPNDPATISVATALLITVALLAGYIPALRAPRVDPIWALRDE